MNPSWGLRTRNVFCEELSLLLWRGCQRKILARRRVLGWGNKACKQMHLACPCASGVALARHRTENLFRAKCCPLAFVIFWSLYLNKVLSQPFTLLHSRLVVPFLLHRTPSLSLSLYGLFSIYHLRRSPISGSCLRPCLDSPEVSTSWYSYRASNLQHTAQFGCGYYAL